VKNLACIFSLTAALCAQTPWYVQQGGPASGTGSVLSPFPSIQQAIVAASAGDVVVVGPGTYIENIDFLGKPVTVRSSGGAAETMILGDGTRSIVWCINFEGPGSILDGFTLTGGGNTTHGGAVRIHTANPTIRNCVMYGNTSYDGGGITCSSGSGALIEGCTITNNSSAAGGGIRISSSSGATVIRDCIVWGNTAPNGPAISGFPGTVEYCCLEGGWAGVGNLASDPMLAANYTLQVGSPCIGAGSAGDDMGALPTTPSLTLGITQPTGAGAAVRVVIDHGPPAHLAFSLFTIDSANAGGSPTGRLFGLHIPGPIAIQQITSGLPPFATSLDAAGAAVMDVLPLPPVWSGTTFYGVTATVDPLTAIVSASAPVVSYVYL